MCVCGGGGYRSWALLLQKTPMPGFDLVPESISVEFCRHVHLGTFKQCGLSWLGSCKVCLIY